MKNIRQSKWAIGVLLALFPAAIFAQNEPPPAKVQQLSLQQAIAYASKNNVAVKNALLDVQAQRQLNREVTGSAYPQLSANGSLVYNTKLPVSLVPAEFFGGPAGTFEEFVFGVKWNATGGVSVSQILFDGQVFTGLQARSTLIDAKNKIVEITDEMIRTNVYKLYYQLVVSKTQIELIDANIERLSKLEHDTKVMFDNGFKSQLDVDRASVQLANAQTDKIRVLNQRANGFLGLKVLIGMPPADSIELTDSLSDEDIRDGVLDASNFDYGQRKDFQASELFIKLNEYNIQRWKLSKIPTLTLNGYYNKNAQRNDFDFFKGGNWFDISAFTLNLNIPIFNGFATNARIAQARIARQKSINSQDSLKLSIDAEIQTAKNNYAAAVSSFDFQKKNMALAENVYAQTKKQFEVGTGDQTAINQAQTDLKDAQNNYINALYSAVIAKVDFLKATGKL